MIPTLGILGGTFDPIHYGHLRLAAEVERALDLAEVRLITAGDPPHRPVPIASAEHRLAMTRLGCSEFPGLSADPREVRRPGPSYTVLTLQELHDEDSTRPLALFIGDDAFAGLTEWRRWQQLFTLAHLIVVARPGAPFDVAALPDALKVQWERRVPITPQAIAATQIREMLARGAEGRAQVRGLLPASVLAYIERNQLYGSDTDAN